MNILVVEDDKLMLKSLQSALEHNDYTVYTAKNSEDAINYVLNNKIDLLISDVMMPGISGLSLVSVLRNVYLLKIPIILISSLHDMPIALESIEIGASCFIPKPFEFSELLSKIKALMSLATD